MTIKDYNKLRRGSALRHKKYGICAVQMKNNVGINLHPLSTAGVDLLKSETGELNNTFFEGDKKMLIEQINISKIPMLVKQTKMGFSVYKWFKPGIVSEYGEYSIRFVKGFDTLPEAQAFAENTGA